MKPTQSAVVIGAALGITVAVVVHWDGQTASADTRTRSAPLFAGTKEDVVAEDLIRQRTRDLARAIGAKDLERVMSFYSPSIVSFDLDPPLRYTGIERKRHAWKALFAAHPGPFAYELGELDVTADRGLAFVHSLNHVKGRLSSGQPTDLWVRWTACFSRIDGVWLIVHDHVSVPADLEHGKAVLNLTP